MISALRPNAWTLAGSMTDGGISWVSPLPYMKSVARPSIETGAREAGKSAPPVVAHVPVVVSDDAEGVNAASKRQLGLYPRLPYYSAMRQDAGFLEAKEGTYSDRLSAALVISGNADYVSKRIRDIPNFGVDEIIAMPLQLPDDPAAFKRTVELMGALARAG